VASRLHTDVLNDLQGTCGDGVVLTIRPGVAWGNLPTYWSLQVDVLLGFHVSVRHQLTNGSLLMPYPRPSGVPSPSLSTLVVRPIKDAIAAQVVALLNNRSRGDKPVMRRADGLFGQSAVVRRVHGDVTTMMVGGVAGLLLQMLHPAVLAGVWDHSNFRADMHGRLRRTARFIALTTYGGRVEAEAALARVRAIHDRVRGTLPNGCLYAANEPALLAWVHVTESTSFLDAWIRYAEPGMSAADQDCYFRFFLNLRAARLGEWAACGPSAIRRRRGRTWPA
jgi:hypothetical protein